MIGGSIAGYSLTPRNLKLIAPKSTIARDITIASTGRLMLIEARLISGGSWLRGEADRGGPCSLYSYPDRNAGAELQNTRRYHSVPGGYTVGDLDARRSAHAGTDGDGDNDPVPAQEERLPLE